MGGTGVRCPLKGLHSPCRAKEQDLGQKGRLGGTEPLRRVCTCSGAGITLSYTYTPSRFVVARCELFCEAQEKHIKEYFGTQIDKMSSFMALQEFCQQGCLVSQELAGDVRTLFKASLAFRADQSWE